MDFRLNDAEEAFRRRVHDWLEANIPRGERPEAPAEKVAFARRWQRTLNEGGWAGLHWPREYGGRGASPIEQLLFSEEYTRLGAPPMIDIGVGPGLTGPTLIHHGTDAQKRRFLPRILSGDDVWCQGFSEPNAGSDLASLRCRGVRDGDHWVVSGQKVWSSKAHFADWLLLLVRTDNDVPRHKGITCMAVDMHSPGVTWRPLVQISGRREFNEVFLEEVRVPVENTIGAVNAGWPLIRTALAHERGTLWAFDFKIRLQNGALALADLFRRAQQGGAGRGADASTLREQVAQAWIESEVFAAHTLRILPKLGGSDAGTEAALQKLFGSEVQQRACEVGMQLAGAYAQLGIGEEEAIDGGEWVERYLYSRSVTISSGTSEVLRNLLAQQALGLPRG